jgi:Cu/Ag efflux pump CusA
MRTIVKAVSDSAGLCYFWRILPGFGFVSAPDTKVDVFPEFAPPQVEIQTIAHRQLLQRGRGVDHRPIETS